MQLAPLQDHTTTVTLSEPIAATQIFPCRPGAPTRLIPTTEAEQSLKQTYLDCLKDVKSKAETLRQSVVALLDIGVPWQHLIAWAKAAGRNDRYSQKLLSQILLDLGIRRREPGAGPKLPREAYLVEAYVHDLYGENAAKFLRAACHVAKDREQGELANAERLPCELPLTPASGSV